MEMRRRAWTCGGLVSGKSRKRLKQPPQKKQRERKGAAKHLSDDKARISGLKGATTVFPVAHGRMDGWMQGQTEQSETRFAHRFAPLK